MCTMLLPLDGFTSASPLSRNDRARPGAAFEEPEHEDGEGILPSSCSGVEGEWSTIVPAGLLLGVFVVHDTGPSSNFCGLDIDLFTLTSELESFALALASAIVKVSSSLPVFFLCLVGTGEGLRGEVSSSLSMEFSDASLSTESDSSPSSSAACATKCWYLVSQ